jgi:hypothetical protein
MKKYSLTSDVIDELVHKMNKGRMVKTQPIRTGFNSSNSHILVVFTGTDYGLNERLTELINAKKNYGFSYDIGFSFSGAMVIGESGIEEIIKSLNPRNVYYEEDQLIFEKVIAGVEGVIVPMSTQDTVAKLAFGIQDSFISTLLWQTIWKGKPVLMDFEDVKRYKGVESKSKGQNRIIERNVSEVIGLGVVDVRKEDYVVGMLNEFKNANIEIENRKTLDSRENTEVKADIPRILTSKDLLDLVGDKKSFKVPSTTIVTPLAIDTAKEKGIEIIKE